MDRRSRILRHHASHPTRLANVLWPCPDDLHQRERLCNKQRVQSEMAPPDCSTTRGDPRDPSSGTSIAGRSAQRDQRHPRLTQIRHGTNRRQARQAFRARSSLIVTCSQTHAIEVGRDASAILARIEDKVDAMIEEATGAKNAKTRKRSKAKPSDQEPSLSDLSNTSLGDLFQGCIK